MNIFATLSPGRVVGRRLFSPCFLDSRRMPSAIFSAFPQFAAFNLPFIRSYSRIPKTDTKKNENSSVSNIKTSALTPKWLTDEEPYPITLPPSFLTEILERVHDVSICHPPLPFVKSGDDRIRFFDPAIFECLCPLLGHIKCRPCEDINDSNAFSSGGTIELMDNVVATYSILGEWDLSDMQAYADHSDYLPYLYEELMATIKTHTPTSLPYKTVFGIICDFEKGSVYRYDPTAKKLYPGSFVYFNKSGNDFSFLRWFASELFSISMHQYRLTLQAQAEICQDSEVCAQWQSMVDLANRAYDLLKREPDDLVEHEKFFSQAIALLEQSTAWPEWAPVLSSAARKARIDRVLAEFMDRIYS